MTERFRRNFPSSFDLTLASVKRTADERGAIDRSLKLQNAGETVGCTYELFGNLRLIIPSESSALKFRRSVSLMAGQLNKMQSTPRITYVCIIASHAKLRVTCKPSRNTFNVTPLFTTSFYDSFYSLVFSLPTPSAVFLRDVSLLSRFARRQTRRKRRTANVRV